MPINKQQVPTNKQQVALYLTLIALHLLVVLAAVTQDVLHILQELRNVRVRLELSRDTLGGEVALRERQCVAAHTQR